MVHKIYKNETRKAGSAPPGHVWRAIFRKSSRSGPKPKRVATAQHQRAPVRQNGQSLRVAFVLRLLSLLPKPGIIGERKRWTEEIEASTTRRGSSMIGSSMIGPRAPCLPKERYAYSRTPPTGCSIDWRCDG